MDADVFSQFELTRYTFLRVKRGGVTGNSIVKRYYASGVFKKRSDLVRGDNSETKESNTTLHVRPDERFLDDTERNLVGHGVIVAGKKYEIISQTSGKNFHTGEVEHYTAVLQESDFLESEDE